MFDRRQFVIGTVAVAASAVVPTIAVAREFGVSPLFDETPYLLWIEHTVFEPPKSAHTPFDIAMFYSNNPGPFVRMEMNIRKTDTLPSKRVMTAIDAENAYFSSLPLKPERLVGLHRIISESTLVAMSSRRGFANQLYGEADELIRLGLVRTDTRIGRWTRFAFRPGSWLANRCPDLLGTPDTIGRITVYGAEQTDLGHDLIWVYKHRTTDGPGAFRVDEDGSHHLVLQERSIDYGTRMKAPLNLQLYNGSDNPIAASLT